MFAHISHVAGDSILTLVTFHCKRPVNVTFKFLISENTKISRQKLYQAILVVKGAFDCKHMSRSNEQCTSSKAKALSRDTNLLTFAVWWKRFLYCASLSGNHPSQV